MLHLSLLRQGQRGIRDSRRPVAMLAPMAAEGCWRAVSGRLCPVIAGSVLSDRAAELETGAVFEMEEVDLPLLLLPFAAAAAQRLDGTLAVIEGQEQAAEALQRLSEDLPALQQNLSQAKATETALRQTAPDPAQTRAILQRAQSAQEAARQRVQEVARDLAVLETRIATHASAAVEEELADTKGQFDRAQKRLAVVALAVAVLRRLDAAPERARPQAQDNSGRPAVVYLHHQFTTLGPEAALTVGAVTAPP